MYEATEGNSAQAMAHGNVQSISVGSDIPAARGFSLFDARAVTLATFFGTPAAGSLLMALNYKRLGRMGAAAAILLLGMTVTGIAIFLGTTVPSGFTVPLGIGLLIGMRLMATELQGQAVAEHVKAGGRLGSKWVAFGVGMVLFVLLMLAVALPIYAAGAHSKVIIGTKDEVFYTGAATKQDAQQLGEALKKAGYFRDNGTSVFVDKGKDGTTVSLVQQEGVWDRPGMLFSAEEVVRGTADAIGGLPVRVKLIDSSENVKRQGQVGRAAIGKDEVLYYGSATQAEAQGLGASLVEQKFFQGRGTSVLLSKDDRGTVISFVVGDGIWDQADMVSAFEAIARQAAGEVGGLPVTVHLTNTVLETKKEFKVQ